MSAASSMQLASLGSSTSQTTPVDLAASLPDDPLPPPSTGCRFSHWTQKMGTVGAAVSIVTAGVGFAGWVVKSTFDWATFGPVATVVLGLTGVTQVIETIWIGKFFTQNQIDESVAASKLVSKELRDRITGLNDSLKEHKKKVAELERLQKESVEREAKSKTEYEEGIKNINELSEQQRKKLIELTTSLDRAEKDYKELAELHRIASAMIEKGAPVEVLQSQTSLLEKQLNAIRARSSEIGTAEKTARERNIELAAFIQILQRQNSFGNKVVKDGTTDAATIGAVTATVSATHASLGDELRKLTDETVRVEKLKEEMIRLNAEREAQIKRLEAENSIAHTLNRERAQQLAELKERVTEVQSATSPSATPKIPVPIPPTRSTATMPPIDSTPPSSASVVITIASSVIAASTAHH